MAKIEPVKNKKHEVIHPITETQAVEGLAEELAKKQETLVSGKNIKKINGESILGNGNIIISGGGGGTITIDSELSETSENPVENKTITQALNNKQETLESGTNIKTINGESIVGEGDLFIQEGDPSAVKFAPQELTEEQKEQARRNIDATTLAEVNTMDYVTVTELPEASAETMGHIFLVGPDTYNNYDRYYTQQDDELYEWVSLGSTEIDLSGYAPKSEVEELRNRLNNLAMTRYYGMFANSSLLPEDADELGYAYVGEADPFAIYEFNGTEWEDTGAAINGIKGQPGIGLDSIESPTNPDGTVIITLTNGDIIVLDLNHDHLKYARKATEDTIPSGGLLPDVPYNLGTIEENTAFSLAAEVSGNLNHYFWMFNIGTVVPTITWPAGLTWAAGIPPTIGASKHYEVSVLGGVAVYLEV